MTDDELAQKRHLADTALRRALELHAEAHHLDDDDELFLEAVAVSAWVDNDGDTTVALQIVGGDKVPLHHVLGLLHRGILMVQGQIADLDRRDE